MMFWMKSNAFSAIRTYCPPKTGRLLVSHRNKSRQLIDRLAINRFPCWCTLALSQALTCLPNLLPYEFQKSQSTECQRWKVLQQPAIVPNSLPSASGIILRHVPSANARRLIGSILPQFIRSAPPPSFLIRPRLELCHFARPFGPYLQSPPSGDVSRPLYRTLVIREWGSSTQRDAICAIVSRLCIICAASPSTTMTFGAVIAFCPYAADGGFRTVSSAGEWC